MNRRHRLLLFLLLGTLIGLTFVASTQPPGRVYFPLASKERPQGSTRTPTPTVTPTATATPYYAISFAEDLNVAIVDGTDITCRVGPGCTLFQIQARNLGNRPVEFQYVKTQILPIGWGAFFCWNNDCEFGNITGVKTLPVGSRDTASLNFRIPTVLQDGEIAFVDVTGVCLQCSPQQQYQQRFTVYVILPTPTPTGTVTSTPTVTPTATATPSAKPIQS